MKRVLILLITMSMLLSGCGWFQGEYHSVTPHHNTTNDRDDEVVSAASYAELRNALQEMVHNGEEASVINVANYEKTAVEYGMGLAVDFVRASDPIGAYAVESIEYELGTSGAVPAIAVEVTYRHSAAELRQIQTVRGMEAVAEKIGISLERYDSSLVLLVDGYETADLMQIAEDYGAAHPDSVMEVPAVTEQTYPESGRVRVLELKFSYQNSRDDLRQMQQQVSPVFAAAELYVSGNDADTRKFSQLYGFLMERFGEYQIKTSITPAYSLLRHGVGDSEAFAVVYAQMCRRAGLECRTVTGTRAGEPWCWNLVCSNGYYYHVDLLNSGTGEFRLLTDKQMDSYVWDYSAYPASVGEPVEPPETSVPEESAPEETTVPESSIPESTEIFEKPEN